MIEMTLLRGWASLVGYGALIAIVVLALGAMVRMVKPGDVMGRLGVIVGVMILCLILPAITVSEWNAMSFLEHLEMVFIGIVVVFLLGKMRRAPKITRRQ